MRKSRKQLLSSALALAVAVSTVFGTAPVTTKAQTTQVTVESQQVAAEDQIIIHAKGTGLYIYAWKDKEELYGEWAGKAMEEDSTMGSGWCYATVPVGYNFIISESKDGANQSADITGKQAGEYWFVNGKLSTSNPEGPTPVPTEAPTPTPAPIIINEITPGDGSQLKAGEAQQISVDANTSIDDGTLYYKYEVKCDGEYVGDHYYSKSNTYSFTPENGKEYKVKISVQAHDEDNTTVTEELTYTGSEEGVIVTSTPTTEGPTPTPPTSDDNATPTPTIEVPTPTPPTSDNQTPTPEVTDVPEDKETETPSESIKPSASPTAKPTATPQSNTDITQTTPTPNVKITPTPNGSGSANGFDIVSDLAVKLTKSKASPQKAGTSIKLTATASGGDGGYQYLFTCKKSGSSSKVTLQKYSTKNTYTWTPKENGTYTLYVTVKDSCNMSASAKITSYRIKGLTVSVSTNKKSPQKAKTKISISAKAANASGKVKYQYIVKLGSKVMKKTKFTASKKYTWKPTKKGTYTLYVKVKDSNITITKKKSFKIK